MESSTSSYEFGVYRVDTLEGVLLRNGQPVSLAPKAFDTLVILLRHNGHLVEKDVLMAEVWPEVCVEEANLTQNISTLRRILGETADGPKFIETVSRRGYRFVASVREFTALASSSRRSQVEEQSPDFQPGRVARFLAVLPFMNPSAAANMEYLSDGITESIINSLSPLPSLRVMSRSSVFRYKGKELDAQQIGRALGVDAVLVGRVYLQGRRLIIGAELVDVDNGWQLWGATYDREFRSIFEVQDEIAKQISAALRLKLNGDEQQQLTKRYTESPEAYEAYLQGRYFWGKYTREGLEMAIGFFCRAITLDSDYALAYAGLVDCYLRLATNYIPPADAQPTTLATMRESEMEHPSSKPAALLGTVKVRYEWDQKAAEREGKRAIELKANYPAVHQWYAAYVFAKGLYDESLSPINTPLVLHANADGGRSLELEARLLAPSQSLSPTLVEQVQVFCTIAREQMEAGNYEAAYAVLRAWWTVGEWPRLDGLSLYESADLLLTAGAVAGWLGSARQSPRGQKHAQALLNGAIGLFEQLGSDTRSAEGQIELAYCYYREGLSDLARATLVAGLDRLSEGEFELRSVGLIRLASVERHAGHLHDSLSRLGEAAQVVELVGPWATGRHYQELAITLKNLGIAEGRQDYFDRALKYYREALCEFAAVGNHRYVAIVENNHGYLLLTLKRLDEAESHLVRARRLFDGFSDKVGRAQVDETLAQLHLAAEQFEFAEQAVLRAVQTLEKGTDDLLLAEALTTQGLVLCRLSRYREAKRVLDRANRVAESCGDSEGAGRALLIVVEEMCEQLDEDERLEIGARLNRLLAHSQQASILERLQKCNALIAEAHASFEAVMPT